MRPTGHPALALIGGLLLGCGSGAPGAPNDFAPPAPYVGSRGISLVDGDGRTLILRGVNIGQDNKSPPYHPDGSPFDTADGYRELARLGVTVIRYVTEWAALEPTRGQYDDGYLDLVAERVGWARDAGILVLIDMHQDLFGEVFSNGAPRWACDDANYDSYEPISPWFQNYFSDEVESCFDDFWASAELRGAYVAAVERVARRFAGEPAVIGYDLMNEPWHGSAPSVPDWEREVLSAFYDQVGAAVRAAAPDQLVFFEPGPLRNTGLRESAVRAPALSGAVYAPHYYGLDYESDGIYDGSADAIAYNAQLIEYESSDLGVPAFVGELGARTAEADAERYLRDLVPVLNQHRLGFAYWDLSARPEGALLDPDSEQPKELLWRWTFVPYPRAIPGELSRWDWDDATGELTVEVTGSGTVELVAPEAWYPDGASVTVSDGEVEQAGGRVIYRTSGGGPHTIELAR